MSVKESSFTPIGTGDASVDNLTFLPTNIQVRLGPVNLNTDTTSVSRCDGWATLSNTSYDSWWIDATGRSQKAGTDRLIYHYNRGGVLVEGTLVDFHQNTPTNFGIKFNFTTNVGNRQIRFRVSDE